MRISNSEKEAVPAVSQLGYVGFGVSDPVAWAQFATQVLGCEVSEEREDGGFFARMDDHHVRIAVHPSGEDDIVYAGWQARNLEEFALIRAQVVATGVETHEGTEEDHLRRRVQGLFRFSDLDSLMHEVYWGPAVHSAPFVPGRRISGFRTGEMGMGHVVLAVQDRVASQRFFETTLGLRVSDFGSGPLVFMRAGNARHHSAALIPAQMHPRPHRLVHLMMEVRELDDVGTALDLCLKGAAPISQTLGRHSNDYSVGFYVITPSGFEIEYAWGARTIDEITWDVNRYVERDVWGHQSVADLLKLLDEVSQG